MRISIPRRAFAAAIHCAAKNEIRYYLNGVMLRISANEVMASATNGHHLFACTFPADWQEGEQSAAFDLIVPYDVAKECSKTTKKGPQDVILSSTDSGLYMLGDRVFSPVDGKFPDIARVIPQPATMGDDAGPGQFNPDVLNSAINAINTWFSHDCAFVHHRGTSQSAVISGADSSAVAIAMPHRMHGEYTGFNVLSLDAAKEAAPCSH